MGYASRIVAVGSVAVMVCLASACAAVTVRSYIEPGAEFPRYRTYNWAPAESLSTGDPRLDSNPFFRDRIQAGVEKNMAARGFERTAAETPDLLVHYHANVTQRIDINGADRDLGYCQDAECRPYVAEVGTLTLDLTDTRTRKLVWRGWAEGTLGGVIDNQAWLEERVDKAVARIVATLPRR